MDSWLLWVSAENKRISSSIDHKKYLILISNFRHFDYHCRSYRIGINTSATLWILAISANWCIRSLILTLSTPIHYSAPLLVTFRSPLWFCPQPNYSIVQFGANGTNKFLLQSGNKVACVFACFPSVHCSFGIMLTNCRHWTLTLSEVSFYIKVNLHISGKAILPAEVRLVL